MHLKINYIKGQVTEHHSEPEFTLERSKTLIFGAAGERIQTTSSNIGNGRMEDVVEASEFLAIPGFINCAMALSQPSKSVNGVANGLAPKKKVDEDVFNAKAIKRQVHAGCTTNILLGEGGRAVSLSARQMEFKTLKQEDLRVSPTGLGLYSTSNQVSIEAPIPFTTTKSSLEYLFGSGDSSSYTVTPWSRRIAAGECKKNLMQLTFNAAKALGLKNLGLIQDGYQADLAIFKIQSNWNQESLETLLESLFLHGGNDNKASAIYKDGELIFSNPEWTDLIQASTMAKYYGETNDTALSLSQSDLFHRFNTIPEALESFGRGEFLVVVDNEDRENEGDLIIAGQDLSPEKAAFMIRYTSGYICSPTTAVNLDRLEIPMMVAHNEDSLQTAYTVSIDATEGTTTGISASDRSKTIRTLADPRSVPGSFKRPGHVLPLRGVKGGVLSRVGHTEASIDLCLLTGKAPVAAICEIVMDDGRMARRDDLVTFGRLHNIKIITISDLVKHISGNNIDLYK